MGVHNKKVECRAVVRVGGYFLAEKERRAVAVAANCFLLVFFSKIL
jgi:hypothetical protein